jgi:uncharacterized coiled-coil protein SlyX|tara:strand:+ start:1014 stop:1268 length:255 start_codon:yes stop_codon:yes gene_type:complete
MSKYSVLFCIFICVCFGIHYKYSQYKIETLEEKISIQEKTMGTQRKTIEALMMTTDKATRAYNIVLQNNRRIGKENKSCSTNYS